MVGGLELVVLVVLVAVEVVVGAGVEVGDVVVGGCHVVVGGCQVVVGSGEGEGAPAPKTHVPYKTPADSDAKYVNRPSEKSRPAKGHPGHYITG